MGINHWLRKTAKMCYERFEITQIAKEGGPDD